MRLNPQSTVRLRPVDLAREHGLSTQAVRNYEDAGILPAAERTAHGYRVYGALHALALRAFVALVPGHGHRTAAAILRAANEAGAADGARAYGEVFRLLDESHAELLEDRSTLEAVRAALGGLVPEADAAGPAAPAGQHGRPVPNETFIGPLAAQLRLRPATLRAWEHAGLVRPRRDPLTGYRRYDAADVRDAKLVHQLRRGGFLLEQIAPLIAQVRAAGGLEPLESLLSAWDERLSDRGLAMLAGAAALDAYLKAARTAAAPPA
ncbi:TioE family transcriptional regulator [Promicromonospora xylanilytica]